MGDSGLYPPVVRQSTVSPSGKTGTCRPLDDRCQTLHRCESTTGTELLYGSVETPEGGTRKLGGHGP